MSSLLRSMRFGASLLISLTLLLAWSHPGLGQDTQRPAAKPGGYSGEDLFRGIFFAEGEVAAKIPTIVRLRGVYGLAQLNEKQKQAVRTLQDSLIAALKRADSRYFVDFQAEVQSGDHFRILAQLKHTGLLISYILFERNKGLGQILDNSRNDRFQQRLAASEAKEWRNRLPTDTTQLYESLKSFGTRIAVDRDVFINRITNRIRNFDIDYALDVDLNVNRYTFVDRYANLNLFRFLDVDRNLFRQFDKIAVNRFVDLDWNPHGDVTVEIETAVYAVAAVAVFVAAVVVLVVTHSDIFNDRGGLVAEQLVNSLAEQFRVRVDIRSNRPYR